MATNYPINPRVRALGKARLDIARRAQSAADWQKLWKPPAHSFPFTWGERWKQCVEYRVDDFAAEVGFYIDVLGLPVIALSPDYAMFTSPEGDFFFAVVAAPQGDTETTSTPPDAIRLQFMVADLFATVEELEGRGIAFEQQPQPIHPASSLHIATFLTPHGICIDLWGVIPSRRTTASAHEAQDGEDIFLPIDEEDDDLSLFTTQDAAPLPAPLPAALPKPPSISSLSAVRSPFRPTIQPIATSGNDLEEEFEDGLDDDLDDENELDGLGGDDDSSQDDNNDIEYVDIDTA
jgi:catechol 2,3-dioxygenase-like lactoylglutathione lyase family enzyme